MSQVSVKPFDPHEVTKVILNPSSPSIAPQPPANSPVEGVKTAQETTEEGKVSQPLDDKYLRELARLEREKRALARDVADLKKRLEAPTHQPPQPVDLRAELEKALQTGQLGYEELNSYLANQPTPENQAILQLNNKIAALQKELEKEREGRSKAQDEMYNNARKTFKAQAVKLIGDKPDEFELIKAEDAADQVVDLIERTYREDGIQLTVEEAAREIEEYLVERYSNVAKLKKIQAKLGKDQPAPSAPEGLEPKQPQVEKQHPTITTLTHSIEQGSSRPLSEKERKARAIAAFQGRLK